MLSPYRALDLTGRLGFLTGKILGDLGTDVIKIEPPGGDPDRTVGPFYRDQDHPERSLYWMAHNASKRGITLNLNHPSGRELFSRLVQTTDFLIESFHPGYLAELGLGYEALSALNPKLIQVSITPYGQSGPYAGYLGSDLEITALSGMLSLVGEPGGAPLRVTVPQAPMWVGAEAVVGALLALWHRGRSGRGQPVDVSAQVAMLSATSHAPSFWDLNRENPSRSGVFMTGRSITGARMRVFWPCRDGWLNFIIYGGVAGQRTNQALIAWMDERGMCPPELRNRDWSKFDITKVTQEEVDVLERVLGDFFLQVTKAEFMEEVTRRGMLGYPVFTAQDILSDPQLETRQFWQELDHPDLGERFRYPGGFASFGTGECRPRRKAPLVGEHNPEIYCGELGLSPEELEKLSQIGAL